MAFKAQLPVRLDPDTESRLEDVARRTGTTKSSLIRMLAKRFVDECVKPDGSVIFPASIQTAFEIRDARSVSQARREAKVSYKSKPKK